MLTRSFIRSYLVLPKGNNGFTKEMYEGGQAIMKEKRIVVTIPSEKEITQIKAWIKVGRQALSLEDRMNNIFKELHIDDSATKEKIRNSLSTLPIRNNDEVLKQLIQTVVNSIDNEDDLA